MADAILHDGLSLQRYLPGIFQEQAQPGTPLHALLSTFECFLSRVEQGIEEAPAQFDPYSARPEFIDRLLAAWVALPWDDEWDAKSQRDRKNYLVTNAAELYRWRGTVKGLRYTLGVYYGLDAEILEWTWPTSMEIGIKSTIGVDGLIADPPDLGRSFTVVLRLDDVQRAGLARFADLIPIALTGQGSIFASIALLKQHPEDSESLTRTLEKIRFLIDTERPAHTRCCVVVEESAPPATSIESMIIEIDGHTEIGFCAVDWTQGA